MRRLFRAWCRGSCAYETPQHGSCLDAALDIQYIMRHRGTDGCNGAGRAGQARMQMPVTCGLKLRSQVMGKCFSMNRKAWPAQPRPIREHYQGSFGPAFSHRASFGLSVSAASKTELVERLFFQHERHHLVSLLFDGAGWWVQSPLWGCLIPRPKPALHRYSELHALKGTSPKTSGTVGGRKRCKS